MRFPNLFS